MPLQSMFTHRKPMRLSPRRRAGLAVLFSLAASAGHAQWLQWGYDAAKTYANTAETALSRSNVKSLTIKWQAQLGGGATTQSDGRIIVCASPLGLSALDPGTGTVLWSQPMTHSMGCKSPALEEGVAYVTTYSTGQSTFNHALRTTDQATGGLLSNVQFSSDVSKGLNDTHPALVGDRLYLTTYLDGVVALDKNTGRAIWKNRTTRSAGNLGLSVASGRVFVNTWFTPNCCNAANEGVFAFDANTGDKLWEYRIPGRNTTQMPMALGKAVYVGDSEGVIHGLNARDGSPLWQRKLSDPLRSPLVGHGAELFAGNYDGSIYALHARTGKELWSRQLDLASAGRLASNLVWANGMLFMTTIGQNVQRLLVMDANTGNILANLIDQPINGAGATITVVDGRVHVASGSGYLYVFGL